MMNNVGLIACVMAVLTIDLAFLLDWTRLAVLKIFTYSEKIWADMEVYRSTGVWGTYCTWSVIIVAFASLVPIGLALHFWWPETQR
jgi:TRAP-type mannitol/chloroaromatic compound transport system permease small subunit